jgi:hypothetical protein
VTPPADSRRVLVGGGCALLELIEEIGTKPSAVGYFLSRQFGVDAVVQRSAPQLNPAPPVQRLMQSRAAEARQLAWSLLRAGLDEISGLSESVGDRRLGEL